MSSITIGGRNGFNKFKGSYVLHFGLSNLLVNIETKVEQIQNRCWKRKIASLKVDTAVHWNDLSPSDRLSVRTSNDSLSASPDLPSFLQVHKLFTSLPTMSAHPLFTSSTSLNTYFYLTNKPGFYGCCRSIWEK